MDRPKFVCRIAASQPTEPHEMPPKTKLRPSSLCPFKTFSKSPRAGARSVPPDLEALRHTVVRHEEQDFEFDQIINEQAASRKDAVRLLREDILTHSKRIFAGENTAIVLFGASEKTTLCKRFSASKNALPCLPAQLLEEVVSLVEMSRKLTKGTGLRYEVRFSCWTSLHDLVCDLLIPAKSIRESEFPKEKGIYRGLQGLNERTVLPSDDPGAIVAQCLKNRESYAYALMQKPGAPTMQLNS